MLEEIIAGQNDPEYLASLALGHLRAKTPQLKLALEGKIRPHHRFLLRRLLDQLRFVEHEIVLLDERLEDIGREQPELSQAVARWDTIPGIDRVAGWTLLAEVGHSMAQFPTAEQLASWASLCPGNHESAGKRQTWHQESHHRGSTQPCNHWLLLAKSQRNYEDLGGDYFDRIDSDGLKRYFIRRLEKLGPKVTLVPIKAV